MMASCSTVARFLSDSETKYSAVVRLKLGGGELLGDECENARDNVRNERGNVGQERED